MYMNKLIEDWDNIHCEQHVRGLLSVLEEILPLYYNNSMCFIDIGANVGKVYDLLKKTFNIDATYMFEPNTRLYKYLIHKYKNINDIYIYNKAVCFENGVVYFDESSMDYQIQHNHTKDINLGLSHITTDATKQQIEAIKFSDFLEKNSSIYSKKCFIKIDTENYDYQILSDLINVIHNFKNKPVIEFENNYFYHGHELTWAQNIINRYMDIGYEKLVINRNMGDGILRPTL